jgi:hypothetical protein
MRNRRTIIIVCVVVLVGIYLWLFGLQTLTVLQTRHMYRNIPVASLVPIDLPEQQVSSGTGTKLTSFGYEFEVPWQDEDVVNVQRKGLDVVPFRSGLQLFVGHGTTTMMIETLIEEGKIDPRDFRAAYGGDEYEFLTLALNTTPASIRLVDSTSNMARKSMLLLVKTIIVPGDSGIFKVHNAKFHGFQYGDPRKRPRKITVALYSTNGLVELTLSRKDGKPIDNVTQADINRAISTMRYVGTNSAAN